MHISEYMVILSVVCIWFGTSWIADAQSLSQCSNNPSNISRDILANISMDTDNGKVVIYLHNTSEPMNWCTAYQQCKQWGSSLVMIIDPQIQSNISELLNMAQITQGSAWIAARRDFVDGWSWVTQPFETCNGDDIDVCDTDPTGGEEYGEVLAVDEEYTQRRERETGGGRVVHCIIGDNPQTVSPSQTSWYSAQNLCYSMNGRLATFDELGILQNNFYWNGLQYRPWMWITDNWKPVTMIFSSWSQNMRANITENKFCLTVQLNNGSWNEEECENLFNYFVCEETIQPPTPEGSTSCNQCNTDSSNDGGASPTTPDTGPLNGGLSREEKLGIGIGIGVGVPVVVAIVLGVYYGVHAKKKKKNGSINDTGNGKVNEMQNDKGEAERTASGSSNGFPSVASKYMPSDYDEINDAKQSSKNIPPPNTAPPPKPSTMGPDPTYALATDPNKPVHLVNNPSIIGPYSEIEVNQFPTRNAFDDNRGSRIMVDNTMYGGPADQQPKQKSGKFNKPPLGKPKGPEKPPKPSSMTKPQVATVIPMRHTLGPKGDEYAEIQKGDTIKK